MHISDQKEELRQSITERLKRLSDKDRAAESRSLCRRLLPYIPEGSTVCGYMPLKTEPNIRDLLQELIDRGDQVFLPRFEGQKLVFRQALNLTDLIPGELKILEPPADAPQLNPQECDMALVPGRAFDRSGGRMGRGNGGYDKWIADQRVANPNTQYIGISLECQLVNEVPMDEHDQRMDAVVTARGMIEA